MVKITLEYDKPEDAIVALGKLIGSPAAVQPAKSRKGRADKGQPREPYGPRTNTTATNATAVSAVKSGDTSSVVTDPGIGRAPARQTSTPTQAPDLSTVAVVPLSTAPDAEKPSAAPQPTPVVAPAAPAAVLSEEVVKAAFEKYFEKFGLEQATRKLAEFGVKRLRDLPAEKRGVFLQAVR